MSDSLGLLDAVGALPEQFEQAITAPSPIGTLSGDALSGEDISSVVIAGMGGSGIVGDVALAVSSPTSRVPIVVVKDDECPGFVDPHTLMIVSSFSGNTSETLTVMNQALERGAQVVAVSTGGRIGEVAKSHDVPIWPVDPSIPCPRAALAALTIPVLRTLEVAGVVEDFRDGELKRILEATADTLIRRRDDLRGDGGEALRLARKIGRTIPLVYGAGLVGKAAALRWKSQFNENPKIPAYVGVVPELTHNEVCGWAQHGDMTRQVLTLVSLRHDFEGSRNAAAMDAVAEITEETVASVLEVHARGAGRLAQFFDLVMLGDFVSIHMALAEGVDPGPVAALDELKQRLG